MDPLRLIVSNDSNWVEAIKRENAAHSVPPLEPHRIGKSLNDGRAYRPANDDAIERIRARANANRRVRLYDDRGGLLDKAVAIFALALSAWCILYFAAELLRAVLS